MPTEALDRIRPLSATKSSEAWDLSLTFADEGTEFRPREDRFERADVLDEPEAEAGSHWLRERLRDPSRTVVVNWQPDTSVVTDVGVFCDYWSTFCYPASDDVSVWPLDLSWVLHYWHEERFYFARHV